MKHFPILLLLLLLPLTASAQKDNFWTAWNNYLDYRAAKRYAELDSNYVGRYPYRWDARVFYNTDGLHLATSGTDSDVRLATGMSNTVGIGLSFRGFGLNYSVALGKKMNFDFGFASYGKRLGFEYSLRVSSRLSGEVSWFGLPRQQAERGDLTLMASNLTVLYNFNPRFSYAAAMKQNAIQRKSAGSFLLAASWTGWDVLGAGPDIISKQTSLQTLLEVTNMLYLRYSIGAGYGYNLVLGQEHWLLHASVIPMWTFYDTHPPREWRCEVLSSAIRPVLHHGHSAGRHLLPLGNPLDHRPERRGQPDGLQHLAPPQPGGLPAFRRTGLAGPPVGGLPLLKNLFQN